MSDRHRPISYDVTHIAAGLLRTRASGIDKVDQAFAKRMVADFKAHLVHYGLFAPRCHSAQDLPSLLQRALDVHPRTGFAPALRWLAGTTSADVSALADEAALPPKHVQRQLHRRLTQLRWLLHPGHSAVPQHSVYLNVAQHLFEMPRYFRWLEARTDVLPVFLVHDLLPLDWPEYFRPGYRDLFRRRWHTIEKHSKALITTSHAVRARIEEELDRHNCPRRPIRVEPLPSPLPPGDDDARLAAVPYFVVVGTIEPRKNHLLLLNIWRRLAQEHQSPPKLVIVGGRGWENEQILDVLDRSTVTRPHVLELSNLGEWALATLIRNARGLLMPSFAEGYGLPLVEALTLGVPVIASDIPVFREVGSNAAIYLHPLDGVGWRNAILALCDRTSPTSLKARHNARNFEAPTWDGYFDNVEAFIRGL